MQCMIGNEKWLIRFDTLIRVWKDIGILRILFNLLAYDITQHFDIIAAWLE
ncbi:hypothetical protein D3C71_2202670 [compost metagenome]